MVLWLQFLWDCCALGRSLNMLCGIRCRTSFTEINANQWSTHHFKRSSFIQSKHMQILACLSFSRHTQVAWRIFIALAAPGWKTLILALTTVFFLLHMRLLIPQWRHQSRIWILCGKRRRMRMDLDEPRPLRRPHQASSSSPRPHRDKENKVNNIQQ